MISITPVTRSMAQTGGTAAINTAGSGTWRASVSDNWILLASSSGTAGYAVGYTVSANNGVEARVGYVYVSGYVHTITQAGLGATLESYSAEFERAGGTGSVRVNAPSGKTWHAQSNVSWITVKTASGTGAGNCSFTVARYDEVSTRSGTLTIADNTFTVVQTGRRMQLTTTSATTDYFAETIKIRVNALASTEWAVSVNAGWMTVTDAGNGRGGDEVKVAVAENPSYNERNGVVTIGTETFTIRQLGRTALVFRINPTEVSTFGVDGATGERIAVAATPDLGWTAAASADWIELYSGYASGAGNGSVAYKVKPNPTLYPRSGSITVTAADGAVAAKRLDIRQVAAVASLTVDEYEFEAAGESLTVGVNTGSIVGWNMVNSLGWLTVSLTSVTGPANITLTAAPNTSVQPRSGVVRIADHEFRVSQKGRGVSVSYDETRVFDADGKTTGETVDNVIQVTADSDVEWTAVASDPTWIVVYQGASGTGNGTVKYIVAPYIGSGEIRTGMITIGSEIVYVTQRPYELSIEPNGTWVDGNAGAGEIQVALDIDGVWNAIATEPWITMVSGYNAGTGSGKVLFVYTDNNTGKERTGKIVIAGEIYTLTQAARQNFAVTATTEGHSGHVSGGGTYSLGTEVMLEAVPESGYSFDHWVLPGGGTSVENPLAFTVTAAQSYGAVFTPLAPQLGVASASLRGVELAWTNVAWATEFRVFRGTSSNRGQASRIATLANNGDCAYLDATGTENQNYWYWVEAVGVEDDVWSNGVQGRREKKTFAIEYTNLRGTTHSNPATYREGTAVSFSAPSARTGFTFAGWTPSGISAGMSGNVVIRANWSQNEYMVRFNLNGAEGTMADESYTYGLWKFLSPTNFTRQGYVFAGWSCAVGSAPSYADSESVKNLTTVPNGIVMVYAVWNPLGGVPLLGIEGDASASVTGNDTDGYVIRPSAGMSEVVVVMPEDFDPTKVTVEVDPEVTSLFANGATIRIVNGSHDITAFLNLPAQDSSGRVNPSLAEVKQSIADESLNPQFGAFFWMEGNEPMLRTSPTKPGLIYILKEGPTLDTIADGDSTQGDGLPWTPNITVKNGSSGFYRIKVSHKGMAQTPYVVKFNANGGSGSMANQGFTYGTAQSLTANAFTRTGYTFAGWATSASGAKTYHDGQTVVNLASTAGATVNLYAKWIPNSYTVRFNANGGSGTMANQSFTYGTANALTANAFTLDKRFFSGWATSASGAVVYKDGQSVSNLTSTSGGMVNLYAKWSEFAPGLAVRYYDLPSSEYSTWISSESSAIKAFASKTSTTSGDSVRFGDTFDSGRMGNNIPSLFPDLATVGIRYDNAPTNSFHGQYAIADTDCFAAAFGGRIDVPTAGTYEFGISADDQSLLYVDGIRVAVSGDWRTLGTGSVDLTAGKHRVLIGFYDNTSSQGLFLLWKRPGDSDWAPVPQSVLFHRCGTDETSFAANGGSGTMPAMSVDRNFGDIAPANSFARTGHSFAGWATRANGAVAYDNEGGIPPDISTLYAKWTPNAYSVKFNANGGSGTMANQSFTYGTAKALTANAFTRTGYTFAGWATSASGAKVYDDQESVSNLTATAGSTANLYAKWTPITYSVKFNANGGSGTMANQSFTYGTAKALTANAFTRTGYTFAGWATSASSAKAYDDQQSVSNLTATAGSTVNLYAKWTSDNTSPTPTPAANGLVVRYYDISSSGYSTWTQSEAAMANYFVSRTPTLVTNTLDWGETLQSGFQLNNTENYFSNYPGLWLDKVSTNRYHGKYANQSQNNFAMLFEGFLQTDVAGTYSFAAACDDAIVLYIDGTRIVASNSWQQTPQPGSISLETGIHRITIATYEDGGSAGMWVEWKKPGDSSYAPIPQAVLFQEVPDTPAELTYCIIDLSAGSSASSYPVSYLSKPPTGGFNSDEYKTTKLVLKSIKAGSFQMRRSGSVSVMLTKSFFIGLFEVTQKQWQLVTGSNPSNFSGDKRPVERVSYDAIRGSTNGVLWPASNAVDADSFLGKLRARTGLDFDLPTEAQWEYACRAGTTTTFSYGDSANGDYMWCYDNSSSQTHEVGTKQPNPWGLYDMHGNVWEWCLDWYDNILAGGADPKGPSEGRYRVRRGSSWDNSASSCTSSSQDISFPSNGSNSIGFRLVRTLSE